MTSKISESRTIAAVQDYISMNRIQELFMRITEEIFMVKPEFPVRFILDFVSTNFPDDIGGFYTKYAEGS